MTEWVAIASSLTLAAIGLGIMYVACREARIDRRIQRDIEKWCDRRNAMPTEKNNFTNNNQQ